MIVQDGRLYKGTTPLRELTTVSVYQTPANTFYIVKWPKQCWQITESEALSIVRGQSQLNVVKEERMSCVKYLQDRGLLDIADDIYRGKHKK